MSVEHSYEFYYDQYQPGVKKITTVDDEIIDSTVVDLSFEFENLSNETLNLFSNYLLNKFNEVVEELINNNLDQYKFSALVQPIKTLCVTKNSCDELIYQRENPKEITNPFPVLG